jgi:hypothetical protein
LTYHFFSPTRDSENCTTASDSLTSAIRSVQYSTPFLAGRRAEVEDFRILVKRLRTGYTEQSLVITGLRGVGKTVLLGEYQKIASEEGWVSADAEVSKTTPFGPQMANPRASRAFPGLTTSEVG